MKSKQYRGQKNQRGAALLFVLVLTIVSAMMIGALVYTTMTWNTLSYSKTNGERALELAESGINSELNYMSVQTRLGNPSYYHTNATQSGEPLPGQPGTLWPVPGKWWVYTTLGSNGNFTTTCSAEVGGALGVTGTTATLTGGARRTISVSGQTGSIFGLYAVFAVAPMGSSGISSFKLIGTPCLVDIVGTVGTDGTVQEGNNTCNYTRAIDANTGDSANSGKQFRRPPISSVATPIWFPSVADMIRNSFSATSGLTDASAWQWLSTNNNNLGVLMWKSGATDAMSTATTTSAVVSPGGYPKKDGTLSNHNGKDWLKANLVPGSTTVKALIFPPGDYYFQSMDLVSDPDTQLVIDNAGLSVGGNPNNIPVRFWFDNTGVGNDFISIPFVMTNGADNSTFRIYYGKDGNTLTMDGSGGVFTTHGAIYAVTAEDLNGSISGNSGATVKFSGGIIATTEQELDGCLIADHISFDGYCKVVYDPTDGNALDYRGGSGITGGYTDLGG